MNDANKLLADIKLRFNIDHPTIEDCYSYGYECALNEIEEGENPFAEKTQEHLQWQEGWWAGFYGEEPLFTLDVADESERNAERAANDEKFRTEAASLWGRWLKITGAIAASAVVGYQVVDLVA
jgi:hypothetical protein